jgi:lipid-A-disaccharide synthase
VRAQPDAVVSGSPGFVCASLIISAVRHWHHYVAPAFSWGPFRARKLKKRLTHIMALLPFEVPFFAKYGIPCTYVGHPAIDAGAAQGDGKAFRLRHGIAPDAPLLCVLPGSRAGEVRRMLPVFGDALRLLKDRSGSARLPVVDPWPISGETQDWPPHRH